MDFQQELQEISALLDLCTEKKGGERIKEWLTELSDVNLGFISYLLNAIRFDTTTLDLIKILFQLQLSCTKSVCEQISEHQTFFKDLSSFLSKGEVVEQDLNFLNVFIIFVFNLKGSKMNKTLYMNVINSVNWIMSEEVLDMALDVIGDNLKDFKRVFLAHKDATLIIQLMLGKLNRSEGFTKLKSFENFAMIIKENMNLCYTTDLMVLCDILLSVFDNRNKVAYHSAIRVLEALYFSEEFARLKYKVENILEALEEVRAENFHVSPELIKKLNRLKSG